MLTSLPYFGESLALLTALVWAVAVIMFKRSGESVHPIALNLFKNVLSALLLLPTMVIVGRQIFPPLPWQDYALLLISGAIGIGISDTLFFKSLNILGAGLSAIVDCLYSPFVIGLSILWLNESLTLVQVIGVVMIISAVLNVTRDPESKKVASGSLVFGIVIGALAMGFNAFSIVMIKPLLENSPLLWATEIRLIGGSIALALSLIFFPSRRRIINSLLYSKNWKFTVSGSFLGAYLAMILWLGGMKYAPASVAAPLNQMSNVFIFVLAAIYLKEPINLRRTVGIILAVAGVFLVMYG
ncbi:DMT family transporter [bacterium]|nr:DMT family transporter [bacterium]